MFNVAKLWNTLTMHTYWRNNLNAQSSIFLFLKLTRTFDTLYFDIPYSNKYNRIKNQMLLYTHAHRMYPKTIACGSAMCVCVCVFMRLKRSQLNASMNTPCYYFYPFNAYELMVNCSGEFRFSAASLFRSVRSHLSPSFRCTFILIYVRSVKYLQAVWLCAIESNADDPQTC